MKKTSIYILSIIIIAVVVISVVVPGYNEITSGIDSVQTGMQQSREAQAAIPDGTPISVRFEPTGNEIIQPTDSMQFDRDMSLPVIIGNVSIIVPDEKIPSWCHIVWLFSLPIQAVCLLILVWKFIRLIYNFSKERIFVRQNVRLMRQFSFLLFGIVALEIFSGLVHEYVFSQYPVNMEGYSVYASWDFPWANLLIALVSLLMAQVWARGIEIQEEQALTI